jgi:HK97 family phage portal protein
MGWIDWMKRALAFPPARPAFDESAHAFGVGDSWSGVTVTEEGAMNLSTVYACVRVVSDAMAALPLILYTVSDKGKKRASTHPTYPVLKEQPNAWMTSFEYRNAKFLHLLLWGNHYSEIEHDPESGQVTGLFPIPPKRVRKYMEGGRLWYEVTVEGLPNVKIPDYRMHHVKGIGVTGFVGLSPVKLAAQSLGLTSAAEEYGSRFFGMGGRPSGVLKHPGQLTDEAYARLQESWGTTGLSQSHKVKILEEGMGFDVIGVPPEEAQFLQTRQFQTAEVARWFRVPPTLIGDLANATYSNSEQQSLDFVKYCLRPWASNDEQALRRDVLIGADKQRYDVEYLFDDLLRGDTLSRAQAYQIRMSYGGLTINEQRRAENLSQVPNGDDLFMPLNLGKVMPDGSLLAPVSAEPPAPEPAQIEEGAPTEAAQLEGRRLLVDFEQRALEGVEQRAMVADAYMEPMAEVMGRTVRKETRDIRKQMASYANFGADFEAFFVWLREYEAELAPFMRKSLGPVLNTMMLAVVDAASREIGKPSVGLTEAYRAWVQGYLERYGGEYGSESYAQLRALVEDAVLAGDEPAAAVETRLTEWDDKRPAKEAHAESVNFSNAGAIAVWEGYRVERVRWRTNAGACPMCARMHDKVVGIRETFVNAGDEVHGAEGEKMTVSKARRHPPLHNGCTCGVSAEVSNE